MCALAVRLGGRPSQWAAEDPMAIATVLELLEEIDQARREARRGSADGS